MWIVYATLSAFFAALDRLSIVFVVFLAALFLGETLGWQSVLGALLIVAGALLITFK